MYCRYVAKVSFSVYSEINTPVIEIAWCNGKIQRARTEIKRGRAL